VLFGCAAPTRHDRASDAAKERWNLVRADTKAKLASEQLSAGHLDQAAVQVAEARRLDPESTALQLMQARVLMGQGRSEDARLLLERVVVEGPQRAETDYMLGILAQQRLDWDGALQHFLGAIDSDPREVAHLTAAVQVLLQVGDAQSGLALLRQHEREVGWQPAFEAAAGECYEQLGLWTDAARAWRRAVRADANSTISERLGLALWRAEEWGEAADILAELVQGGTASVTLQLALVECLIQLDRGGEAREFLTPILRQDPRHRGALRLLAEAQVREGALEQALLTLARALHAAPADEGLLELGAAVAHRLQRHDLAARYAGRLLDISPASAIAARILTSRKEAADRSN
jgi:Tfp pilus assembly protein PilF